MGSVWAPVTGITYLCCNAALLVAMEGFRVALVILNRPTDLENGTGNVN